MVREVPWQDYQFDLAAGTHHFEWIYRKDAALSEGADLAVIDNLDLPIDSRDSSQQPAAVYVRPALDGTLDIEVQGVAGESYVIEASKGLQTWQVIHRGLRIAKDACNCAVFQEGVKPNPSTALSPNKAASIPLTFSKPSRGTAFYFHETHRAHGWHRCGKSTLVDYLIGQGMCVDTDQLAREALSPGQPAYDTVMESLKGACRLEDGTLDRSALGHLVFNDDKKRRWLEGLLHPVIRSLGIETSYLG